jgi:hypothetical protein
VQLELIRPAAEKAEYEVHWPRVEDSLYYRIRIVSDEGDLLWQDRAQSNRWPLPTALELEAGQEYFIRVDAFVSRSRSISSDFVPFTTSRDYR